MSLLSTQAGPPLIVAIAGLATFASAYVFSVLAVRAGVLPDRPNGRSSHETVTPRSGGIAIFAAWAAGMAIVAAMSRDPDVLQLTVKIVLIAGFVLFLGLADDVFAPRAMVKFAGQVAAAAIFVAVFGALKTAPFPIFGDVELGIYAAPVTIFWIVAFMNAFNFMDGVNGIAAACGAFALFGLAVASAYAGSIDWAVAAALCAVALCAFLPVNFPGGRIFMGDNGSQTAGFLVAAIAVAAANDTGGAASALFMPIAILPFLFDVAFTLGHRIVRKQNIAAAHREHLYQLLLRLGYSHARVTAVYLSLTALTTTGAVLMLRLAPSEQWYAPASLLLLMATPAGMLFARARRLGLLDSASREEVLSAPAEPEADSVGDPAVHAAE
jgi:UDP-GlcNAc:undecaprenyl-phosphate GlcNAc-1-phosphate transferase